MRRLSVLAASFALAPTLAFAHVTVAPREAKPGVKQQYTVRVPTEGQVATTSVYLEVPEGMTVTDVPHPEGATHEVKKDGNRIAAITWTTEIPPKQRAEFVFRATNPAATGQITWNIQQRFADGKVSNWTPGTKLTDTPATTPAGAQAQPAGEVAAIERWLADYDTAFNAKDLDKLAAFYHQDVTIYEGGGVNSGWADYRDHHLGPELKQFQNLQFSHSNRNVQVLGDGRSAYVISHYAIKAKTRDRPRRSRNLGARQRR